jgi:hypothetical protein
VERFIRFVRKPDSFSSVKVNIVIKDATRICFLTIVKTTSIVVVIVVALQVVFFRLWNADLTVPFSYWGDTLWFLVPVKGMLENGWVYEIPQLSAPFGLSAAAFPAMTNLDWAMMKAISLFVSEPGLILNLFWLISMVLTALSANLALHMLGLRTSLAGLMAVIYAFLPFALLRNVAHISLVYYSVPLIVMYAIFIARGCDHPQARIVKVVGYSAIIAQGLCYIYFSFFSVILFAFAGLVGFTRQRKWAPLKGAAVAILVLLFAASLNLIPTFHSWHTHGKPPEMNYKSAQEAEVYGLKIRKMIAPHVSNKLPIFKQWGSSDLYAGFPHENENVTARLGPMAAAGFLFLLMVSAGLIRLRELEKLQIRPIAALTLFALLFTTVGGFGAIFNQIIPDLRCYNRFSVFIAFLALAGMALWIQGRIQHSVKLNHKVFLLIALMLFGAFSLYDQLLDSKHLNIRRPADEISARQERRFVKQLESLVLPGTSVFQLPITGFPPDAGTGRMLPYDHARPYFWSSTLNFSWPSFSNRHAGWLLNIQRFQGRELLEALVLSGFRLVWVDRFGYTDNGEQLISAILEAGAEEILQGESPRYVALDLSRLVEELQNDLGAELFKIKQGDILNAPVFIWNEGVYGLEHNPEGRYFWWSRAESSATIHHNGNDTWYGKLSVYAGSGKKGAFSISGAGSTMNVEVTADPVLIKFPLVLQPKSTTEITFSGEMGVIDLPPGETRDLHFYLMDFQLTSATDVTH